MSINRTRQSPQVALENLRLAARLCPTWIQTAMFALDGEVRLEEERAAYLDFLARCRREAIPLQGVLLYALARPSMQPEAGRLTSLPASRLQAFAAEIEALGLKVKLSL